MKRRTTLGKNSQTKKSNALPKFGPKKCPIYLRPHDLVLLQPVSKASKICCQTVFSAVEPRVIFSTNELLSVTGKVVLLALQKSNVIYQFACHGDSRDIGRTSQWLQNRIKPHVPKSIRSCFSSQKRLFPARRCKSSTQTNTQSSAFHLAIGLHHLQNPVCAQHYDDSRFAILAQDRPPLHLSALQVTFIKTSNRSLLTKRICVQLNDCVLMTLFHWSLYGQSRLGFFL